MNKNQIFLTKCNKISVDYSSSVHDNMNLAATMNAEMMQFGYIMDHELFSTISSLSKEVISSLYTEVISILKKLKCSDVKHKPFYPNFPNQVMSMSVYELYMNAAAHYWSYGLWKPEYKELEREIKLEDTKFQKVSRGSEDEFRNIFHNLVKSNISISDYDKKIVSWFIRNYSVSVDYEVPFKENLCFVASEMLDCGRDITSCFKTATDVLRFVTVQSGGDVSLAENTKFVNFPRSKRKLFLSILERTINEEEVDKHKNKWVRLFHNLHVGEYARMFPKTFEVAKKVRSGEKIMTYSRKLENCLLNPSESLKLLRERPGVFARKIDFVLRENKKDWKEIVETFSDVCDKVSTRVLYQLLGHLNSRNYDTHRVIFPKGNTQRAMVVHGKLPLIQDEAVLSLMSVVQDSLMKRFSELPSLGKVYVSEDLKHCPVPMAQRSASESLFTVARGTRLPFGDLSKGTLRFFIHWKGMDVDLSASMHDENFKLVEYISYTNLRSGKYNAAHSGDITRAPNGASEFIDIDIESAAKYCRYIVMNVYSYSGETFEEIEQCFAGWMTREFPKSNEIFDPKSVVQRVDLKTKARCAIPAIFDLKERKMIWVDIAEKDRYGWADGREGYITSRGINVEAMRATTEQMIYAFTRLDNKFTLYELFKLHGEARGQIVENEEDADIKFSLDGDVTPYSVDKIASEYMM